MRRRDFIGALASVAVLPLAARAQQPAVPVIGLLIPTSPGPYRWIVDAFRAGLAQAGFVEGRNVVIEYRWGEGRYDVLPALADDLVKRRVAVIATMGDAVYAARAAQPAGTSQPIPIVFAMGDDRVVAGLVASLNRPGGHITGATSIGHSLGAKRVEFLRELIPGATTLALLINPKQSSEMERRDAAEAAAALGWRLLVRNAATADDIETAFTNLAREQIGGMIVATDAIFFAESGRLAALAASHALPVVGPIRTFAAAGGLMSFGASIPPVNHQAGLYVGRILKGEKPADLPVVQPTKFELVINLKAAKAIGLEIPPTLLARADEVIEKVAPGPTSPCSGNIWKHHR
jgi:putative tryptophan/tyrosine transport system substrate-binding protein